METYIKNKQRIKTKQCAPRVGAHQRGTGRKTGFFVVKYDIMDEKEERMNNYNGRPNSDERDMEYNLGLDGGPSSITMRSSNQDKGADETLGEVTPEQKKREFLRRIAKKVLITTGAVTTAGLLIFSSVGNNPTEAPKEKAEQENDQNDLYDKISNLYPDAEGVFASENLISLNMDGVNYSFGPSNNLNEKINGVVVENGVAKSNEEDSRILGKVEGTMPMQDAMNELRTQVEQNR